MQKLEQMSDEEILKLIGNRFREIRLSKDMTQQAMAKASGLSVFTITQAENGHNISILNVLKGLRALDCLGMLRPFLPDGSDRQLERKHASFHHNNSNAENQNN